MTREPRAGGGIPAGWTGTCQGPAKPPPPLLWIWSWQRLYPPQVSGQLSVPPSCPLSGPPRGSLELAGSSAKFQATVASLITLLHDTGSWGCPGWRPWVQLVWEAEGGGAQMLLPQGRPLVHSHLGSSCTGQEFSVPRQTLEPGREMLTVLLRRQVGSETKKGGGSCQMPL